MDWLKNLFGGSNANRGLAGFSIKSPDGINYNYDAQSNSLIRANDGFVGPSQFGDQIQLGNQAGQSGFSLGGIGSLLGAGAGLLQGFAGLRQAQMAEKALGLAQDQFNFQKGLANRNLANQAKIINNQYDSAGQVAAGMMNGKDADGNYGYVDPATVKSYASYAKSKHVDGSAVG